MIYGADYYPEHWEEERWEVDAGLMEKAHINMVRVAEFSWAKLEPREGEYDFSWLDRAIAVLYSHGIRVVMGTPTATPPKWLVDEHHDILAKDVYGRVREFGTRRHYCFNSPAYRKYTEKIVRKMAEHYRDNPAVAAWQIDNEFGCADTTRCYCEHCRSGFKKWLKYKYGTIENLNREWGTIFWSQTYNSFDDIILPMYTVCFEGDKNYSHNPGLLLDYYRFCSDSVVSYQKLQADIIRKNSNAPITHNFMGHFNQIDYFNLGKGLDFVSWDNYPDFQWGRETYQSVAMAHDLMRGIKNKNFWVMEEQSGPCGWSALGNTPKPGEIRLWTYQAAAHGAEAILYFRWRACTFGTEEYWYGILDHDGIPRRRYNEVQKTGDELQKLSDIIVGSKVLSEVAIIKSYDNAWSHEFQKHNRNFDYNSLLLDYYKALSSNNINCDIVSIREDLNKYKVVFAPAFNLMDDEIQKKLEEYVKNGGTIVVTFRSGTRNWNNSMTKKTLPGYFKEMSGIEVEEFDSLNDGRTVGVSSGLGTGKASMWCDVIVPDTAEVIAEYNEEFYAGKAAVTVNSYGSGKVYYIGCDLDDGFMKALIENISKDASIEPLPFKPEDGVEIVAKEKDGEKYYVILNHNNHPVSIGTDRKYKELISESIKDGDIGIEAFGVAVIEEKSC